MRQTSLLKNPVRPQPLLRLTLAAAVLTSQGLLANPTEALVGPAPSQDEPSRPALFRDLDFPGAMAAGKSESKLVLLDAMTSWCGPCKVMDATTWVDPGVAAWVGANAVAVQLDMDVHESVKTKLAIGAFPTMVLLRPDGSEFDRVVGLRTPEEMMTWLRGAESGTREIDRVRAEMRAVAAEPTGHLRERARLASAAASLQAPAEAGAFVLWLWKHETEDAAEQAFLRDWRLGRGRSLTADLVRSGAPGFATEVADEIARRDAMLRGAENGALRSEWIALHQATGNERAVASWASILSVEPGGQQTLKGHGNALFDLLVDQGQWAAAGHALDAPLDRIRFLGDNLGAYDVKPAAAGSVEGSAPKSAPKTVPMIPMGRMKPATAAAPKATGRKSIPAIPLGGMKPAQKGKQKGTAAPKPAKTAPKSIPAIPMGGMKPATPGKPQGGAMPAIPMTGPKGTNGAVRAPRPAAKSAEQVAADVRGRLTHQLRRTAGRRYAALHAAGRTAEADAVAALLLQYANDNPARAALVGCAIRAGQLSARTDVHVEWLDDIARGAVK